MCSMLSVQASERMQWFYSGVFIVNFELIQYTTQILLQLTLNICLYVKKKIYKKMNIVLVVSNPLPISATKNLVKINNDQINILCEIYSNFLKSTRVISLILSCRVHLSLLFPANIYLFKINNTNSRKRREICLNIFHTFFYRFYC